MTSTQQIFFQLYFFIMFLTIIWIIVDQIIGYAQMFKSWNSKQEELVPFERSFIRKNTLASLIYPIFIFEVFSPLPLLGLYHWSLYSLIILPAFGVYGIYVVISNYQNVDKFLEFDGESSLIITDNPFELRGKRNAETICVNDSNLKEVIVTRPIMAGPPNNMFGTADFIFTDDTSIRITLLTLGDPTILFKRYFKKKLKSKRRWKPIDPDESW